MAEKLGEAILELRTDDSKLTGGIEKAEGEARGLASTFKSASDQASGSLRSIGTAATEMAATAQGAARAATSGATGIGRLGAASRLSSFHLQNLSFQANDLVMGIASGQPIFRTFIQQGFQIAQIGQQAGVGLGGMVREMLRLVTTTALAHPVLLALAAATGLAFAAVKAFQIEANDGSGLKEYVKTLGLTQEETKKLTDVTVTTGDMFTGLWRTIAERAGVDPSLRDFKAFMLKTFLDAVHGAVNLIADLYGETVGTYRAIVHVWNELPAMLKATFARAVNGAADELEGFINNVIGGINNLARMANAMLGTDLFGQIGSVQLPRMEADFSKSFGNIHGIVRGEIAGATREAKASMNGFIKDWEANGREVAQERLAAQAARLRSNDAEKNSTDRATKALRDHTKALKDDAAALDIGVDKGALETGPIGIRENLEALAKALPAMSRMIDLTATWNQSLTDIGSGALRDVVTGLAAAATGQAKLGDVASQTFKRLLAGLIQLVEEMLILKAVSAIFGKGSPITSFIGSAFGASFSGGHAAGGLIPSGTFGIVGEKGPEPVIATPQGAMVLPNSSLSRMSGGTGQQAIVRIEVAEGQLFEPRVQRISGNVAVEVVKASAPTIRDAAVGEMARQLSRPRM